MAVSCTPEALATAAACFNQGYGRVLLQAMRIAAWCNFLNGDTMDCTPEALAQAANCIVASLDPGQMDAVETWLACQIANSGGGGGGGAPLTSGNGDPSGPPVNPTVKQFYEDEQVNAQGKHNLWVWTNNGGGTWYQVN